MFRFKTTIFLHTILVTSMTSSLIDNVLSNNYMNTTNITCLNGGTPLEGKCRCDERFEGRYCEIEPCLNGGRRIKSLSNEKCFCPYGLTGQRCESVTHCIEGKGKLINGRCKCEDRWSGVFCHLRTCYNGVTVGGGKDAFCLCDIGFTGPFCDTPITCVHGKITAENICVCEDQWEGEHCSKCIEGYVQEGDKCKPVKTEKFHVGEDQKNPAIWPITILGVASIFIILLCLIITLYFLKRYRTKLSKTSSEVGTDV